MLWSAVNRVSRSGETIGPDQRVSPYEGLKAITAWAAEQYGEQENKGTLEVGKLADLVILERDPLQVAPNAIKNINVALVRDQVVIGDLASTRMAGPPELMALEERFAGTLRTVNRFHVRGSRLELLRDETVVATFGARN
jgi:urease alpha subunit